ncbi:unnamed protein product [Boreogadus saida]
MTLMRGHRMKKEVRRRRLEYSSSREIQPGALNPAEGSEDTWQRQPASRLDHSCGDQQHSSLRNRRGNESVTDKERKPVRVTALC